MSDETTTKRRTALHLAFVNGTADRIERERQEKVAAELAAMRERQAAELRRLAARTEAEKWVEEILPELVRKAAADGDTWVHVDRDFTTTAHRGSPRAAVLRELGLELRAVSRSLCDPDTGRVDGYEYDWLLDLEHVRTL